MATKWYIGKERSKDLLEYAYGVLAKYAYWISPEQFRSMWNLLKTRIPLWEEERRGPLDRMGNPLYSQQGYKDFIAWWIHKLVNPPKEAEDMSRVTGASWINEVFDPTRKLFGTQKLAAGVVEDAVADLKSDMHALPEEYYIGDTRARELYLFAIGELATMLKPIQGTGQEAQLASSLKQFKAWLKSEIMSWKDEFKSPYDPSKGVPIALQKGTGLADRIRESVQRMLYANIERDYPTDYSARHLPTYPGPQLGVDPSLLPPKPWIQAEEDRTGDVRYMGTKSFSDLYTTRGEDLDLREELQDTGLTYSQAKSLVNGTLMTFDAGQMFNVGERDELTGVDEAAYNSAVTRFKAEVMSNVG